MGVSYEPRNQRARALRRKGWARPRCRDGPARRRIYQDTTTQRWWLGRLLRHTTCRHRLKARKTRCPVASGWALMGLLGAGVNPMEPVGLQGVSWLVRGQTDLDGLGGASWPERLFTGVGFVGKVYLGYGFYLHYIPILALGKYMRALTIASRGGDDKAALAELKQIG